MADTAIVTTKGRLVIPAPMRRRHGIKRGTRVCFVEEGDKIVLRPLTPDYFQKAAGMLGIGGKALQALLEDRKREREL